MVPLPVITMSFASNITKTSTDQQSPAFQAGVHLRFTYKKVAGVVICWDSISKLGTPTSSDVPNANTVVIGLE